MSPACRSTQIEELPSGGLSIGATVRNTAVAAHRRARALPGSVAGDPLRRLRTDPQHGDGRRQPDAADALSLLLRPRGSLQQAAAAVGVRCDRRLQPDARDPRALGRCIATHPSDMCVALAALDATVHVDGPNGTRSIPFDDFHRLPGDTPHIETELQADELITSVEIPPLDFATHSLYRKVRDRASYAFALVSVAAASMSKGASSERAPRARRRRSQTVARAFEAERVLAGAPATTETFRRAADAELAGARRLCAQPLQDRTGETDDRQRAERSDRTVEGRDECHAEGGQDHCAVHARRSARSADATPADTSADRCSRVDGPLEGHRQARFTAEFALEGLAHAVLVYSTIAKGRIVDIDTTAAEAASGFVGVITHDNAPRMKAPRLMNVRTARTGFAASDLPILQDDRVHWNGQPVAVVVADTLEQAEYAASLVRSTTSRDTAHVSFDDAQGHAGPPDGHHRRAAGGHDRRCRRGVWPRPTSTVDNVYRTPWYNHNAIEPHATIAAWNDDDTSACSTRRRPSADTSTRSPKSSA